MINHGSYRNYRYWKTVFDWDWGVCHGYAPTDEGYPWNYAHGFCDEFFHIVRVSRKKGIG